MEIQRHELKIAEFIDHVKIFKKKNLSFENWKKNVISLALEKHCRELQTRSQRGCRLKIQVFWEMTPSQLVKKVADILWKFTTPSSGPKQSKKSEPLKA